MSENCRRLPRDLSRIINSLDSCIYRGGYVGRGRGVGKAAQLWLHIMISFGNSGNCSSGKEITTTTWQQFELGKEEGGGGERDRKKPCQLQAEPRCCCCCGHRLGLPTSGNLTAFSSHCILLTLPLSLSLSISLSLSLCLLLCMCFYALCAADSLICNIRFVTPKAETIKTSWQLNAIRFMEHKKNDQFSPIYSTNFGLKAILFTLNLR